MSEYNGHKNRNYWNVALWLNGDEHLYRLVCACIGNTRNRTEAIDTLMGRLPIQTPDGTKYTKRNVRAALKIKGYLQGEK